MCIETAYFTKISLQRPRNLQISLLSRPLLTITDFNKFGMPNFGHSKFLRLFALERFK